MVSTPSRADRCAAPATAAPFAWPAGIPSDLPHPTGATVTDVDPGTADHFEIMVAGPAALLVGKVIKLRDRALEVDQGRRDRRKNKDALDVLRILNEPTAASLAYGFGDAASSMFWKLFTNLNPWIAGSKVVSRASRSRRSNSARCGPISGATSPCG